MQSLALTAMYFQDDAAALAHDVHSMMIAQWIMAICILLVILGALIAVFIVLGLIRKVEKKVEDTTKLAQAKAFPLIAQGQELLEKVQAIVADLQPKIASISTDVQHISGVVKGKVDEAGVTFTDVNGTVQDVNGKTRAQVARVNGIVTDALTATEHFSRTVQHGIRVPLQKMAGWVAASKATVEGLAERVPFLQGMMPPAPTSRPGSAPPRPASTPQSTTGTAAPGGPPFVPAPDRTRQ